MIDDLAKQRAREALRATCPATPARQRPILTMPDPWNQDILYPKTGAKCRTAASAYAGGEHAGRSSTAASIGLVQVAQDSLRETDAVDRPSERPSEAGPTAAASGHKSFNLATLSAQNPLLFRERVILLIHQYVESANLLDAAVLPTRWSSSRPTTRWRRTCSAPSATPPQRRRPCRPLQSAGRPGPRGDQGLSRAAGQACPPARSGVAGAGGRGAQRNRNSSERPVSKGRVSNATASDVSLLLSVLLTQRTETAIAALQKAGLAVESSAQGAPVVIGRAARERLADIALVDGVRKSNKRDPKSKTENEG